ncbi:GAP family protein [Streptomyces sp. NPDC089919]|uniref:GAP family protein n=1 Tax=Streptomyces sp. NPDC089919 TaxID=3155188 RepID=UPI0034232029
MLLDLLVIGLVITLYPLPVMAFVLVLSAPRGVWKGLAFILAWLGCLVAVIASVLLITGGQPLVHRSPPSTAALAVKLAIGAGLVGYAAHRRRTRGDRVKTRKGAGSSAMERVDRAGLWSAAGLAVLLQPWGMVGAGAATVVKADLDHLASYLALMGFCLLATASLLAMELYMVFAPDRARGALARLRAWLSAHKEPAVVVACLGLGLWLVSRSLYGLTS